MSRLTKLPVKMSAGLGLSMIDRAVKERMLGLRCTKAELAVLRDHFLASDGDRCFYCNGPEPKRWDHLHPVSRGGATMPGNLVPACPRCDDSKQDRDVAEWVASTSPHRPPPERLGLLLSKIDAYRKQFQYEPAEFESRLTPEKRESYSRFRAQIDALRRHLEVEGLIDPKRATMKGESQA